MFMKKVVLFMLSILVVSVFSTAGIAGVFEQRCQACHGIGEMKNVARSSKDDLLKKFKTKDELVAAAKAVTDTDMAPVQNDIKLLEEAAADIGLE